MRAAFAILAFILIYLELKASTGGMLFIPALAIICFVMFPLFSLGARGKTKDQLETQKKRNDRFQSELRLQFPAGRPTDATSANSAVSSSNKLPNLISKDRILFLRPFLIDNSLQVKNPRQDGLAVIFIPFYRFIIPVSVSLDDAVQIFLKRYGELVAIGRPGELIGATRASVDDDHWQHYVSALAYQARAIIMFPGLRPGTIWEIQNIRNSPELLRKTIFAFPPGRIETWNKSIPDTPTIATTLNEHGFRLPADLKAGEAISFDQAGNISFRRLVIEDVYFGYRVNGSNLKACVAAALAASPR